MSVDFPKPGAYYNVGYSDPRSIYTSTWVHKRPYGAEHKYKNKWGSPLMQKKKVDAHEYKTEAKDLPIDVCKSMWIIKYGNEAVSMALVSEQDNLMWEIGNRLWWSNDLEYDKERDTFTCRS